ncbi:ABC transporter permease [Chryseolinea lacunae]|uniref:ABC transporter permease n=1 Tax=Chryseolinea lacunae TaxID=2801331 RepID=A0ABS1KQF7_9BACT|nr:ABC transporter permease [Chryseolinea lacunae]MBL0741447.1 ABC transporter permease [Chryseolinea lacunae]
MMPQNEIAPPGWVLRFLRFFLKKEYLEEIEGDMEEIFQDNIESIGARRAKRVYALDMLGLLRPVLLKHFRILPPLNQYAMFRNYFKTSFRSLGRNPLTSFINVFGLSVAIGICLVVFAVVEYDRSIDRFHVNKDDVYLVTFFGDIDGATHQYGRTPRPLGEMMKADFANVRNMCTVQDGGVVVKHGANTFHERVRYTNAQFLNMFTFPLKWGTAGSLADVNSIILSEEMAIKYFGDENPLGQDILVKFDETNSKAFMVTGVAQKFPRAHAIGFDFLINDQNMRVADSTYNASDWKAFVNATFVQVSDRAQVATIAHGMEKYKRLQNEALKDRPIARFAFVPLADLHEQSADIRDDISVDAPVTSFVALSIIGVFMLGLACFNYINIAIVSAARRLKEIGVRKVIGANRLRVVVQFLSENIVITFFAMLVGLVLGVFVFAPWFTGVTHRQVDVSLVNGNLWLFLLAVLLVTGVASGLYPAFYISRFEAATIFKGSVQFGKKNPLTKLFLSFQLVLACVFIVGAITFTQNIGYQAALSWGYNQRDALYVSVPDAAAFGKLEAKLLQDPNVLSVSASRHHLGKDMASAVAIAPGKQYEVQRLSVDASYFETMGIERVAGRVFNDHQQGDHQRIVVNQLFAKNMAVANAVGQVFEMDGARYEVIGVVKDFHADSFYEPVVPTVFTMATEDQYRYLTLRAKPGAEQETYATLKAHWTALFPETPFDGGRQEELFTWYFDSVDIQARFGRPVAGIAILLVALGLYGLVTLNVSGRTREFSIRKVLGANARNVAASVGKQYVVLTVVSLALGAPVSYVLIKALFASMYPDPMPISLSAILLAMLLLVGVLVAVVSSQVRKVLKASPVDGLKVE